MAETTSIQDMVTQYINTTFANLNKVASDLMGVDVMWFRATPDKKNQDVIFQSYTLFGVEDCPLSFRAMYKDTGYDDAALTYSIMGIDYAIPNTIEIPVNTWYEVTNYDNTIPQKSDIVYIPIANKLMEVVSSSPVKSASAQLTAYKVNLSTYRPTRSRIVGENLKESIENHTTNLEKQFGKSIEDELKNVIDSPQMGLLSSTVKDTRKTLEMNRSEDSNEIKVNTIVSENLMVDGHIFAKTYYDLSRGIDKVVTYNISDKFVAGDTRCLSIWFNLNGSVVDSPRNIKSLKDEDAITISDDFSVLTIKGVKSYDIGNDVTIERGKTVIFGTVLSNSPVLKVKVNPKDIKKLNATLPDWHKIPGLVLKRATSNTLLCTDGNTKITIAIKGNNVLSIKNGDTESITILSSELSYDIWYGLQLNISDEFRIDIFKGVSPMSRCISMEHIRNKVIESYDVNSFYIPAGSGKVTNIRYYDTPNTDIDKQIIDLITYNIPNDSRAIINDSADVYLNKPYFGRQR